MFLEFPYVHEHKAGDCMVEQTAKSKVSFFFPLSWLEEFYSIVLSILMKFNQKDNKWEKKKKKEKEKETKKQQKAEISIRD